ncbi:putative isomerase YbhE [Patellaria atrata CBS 101060]|uniref:Isomerase YbhE n=1 Tax=Patellaria atrata CBS 101060 TaxID=1346257 RepID=A0A9P4SC48_9PEZI|nr:putative isomerase YbhE [Patellaria atrata CBS 101060]
MRFTLFPILALAGSSTAAQLILSTYNGSVTSLSLEETAGRLELTELKKVRDCGGSPSWLELDPQSKTLLCIDEAWSTPMGAITSYKVGAAGEMTKLKNATNNLSGVTSHIFGKGKAVAVSNFGGAPAANLSGSITTFTLNSADGDLKLLENVTLTMDNPTAPTGETAGRQNVTRAHQVITDPTGQFLVVVDFGADKIRWFGMDANNHFRSNGSVTLDRNTGPRHGIFWSPDKTYTPTSKLFYFVVSELKNTITSFAVTYVDGGMKFEKKGVISTFGPDPTPKTAAASEIQLSPDNKFIVVANRLDGIWRIQNPDPTNSTLIVSDSLSTFMPKDDGSLTFFQNVPAGGENPRHFSINKKGDRVAVALQANARVVILEREIACGSIKGALASMKTDTLPNMVIWNEE